jgi:hypothetical protein
VTGTGGQIGPLRPDWGPEWADLKCDECGATWTGPIGEICPWCIEAEERQRKWQAELVLKAPEVDLDDIAYEGVMRAWRQRLKVAAGADIITERKAREVWERAINGPTARLG